jgi:hypothetical protein
LNSHRTKCSWSAWNPSTKLISTTSSSSLITLPPPLSLPTSSLIRS